MRWGEAYRPDVNNEGCNIVTIQSIPEKLSRTEKTFLLKSGKNIMYTFAI